MKNTDGVWVKLLGSISIRGKNGFVSYSVLNSDLTDALAFIQKGSWGLITKANN